MKYIKLPLAALLIIIGGAVGFCVCAFMTGFTISAKRFVEEYSKDP